MRAWVCIFVLAGCVLSAQAQINSTPTRLRLLTNKEALLQITATNGSNVTLRAGTDVTSLNPLLTFRSTGVNNHIDGATPYLNSRFYRAHYAPTNAFTGDHFTTTNGDLIIQPINHAAFVMSWNGKMIYNDPVCAATLYSAFPKADLVLLSHHHGDHFNPTTLSSVTNATTRIIAPQITYNQTSFTPFRSITTILGYGASTTVQGISVQAVRATNGNHTEGVNNAYVTTIGGKRILTTGDCGPGPDLRALQDLDIMFVCMNSFTMEVPAAATLVREMRPKVVFPYHYGSQCSSPSYDVQLFKRLVGNDLGIEVRLRKWY